MKVSLNFQMYGLAIGIIFVAILVALWPKKRKELNAGGWRTVGDLCVSLQEPNANYTLEDLPTDKGKYFRKRVNINLPEGKTGDRLVIRNGNKKQTYDAYLGPMSLFSKKQVATIVPKAHDDVICDNTNGKWDCNGTVNTQGYNNSPPVINASANQYISLLKVLCTLGSDGAKLDPLISCGFDLLSAIFSIFGSFGSTTSVAPTISLSQIATIVAQVVKAQADATYIGNVQDDFDNAARWFWSYGYKKNSQYHVNREYSQGGDPSIVNLARRTALYNLLGPDDNTSFLTLLGNRIVNICQPYNGSGYGNTDPSVPGGYTWTHGNNWLLLMAMLTLYMSMVQECMYTDIDNKDANGNWYTPWSSIHMAKLQASQSPFVIGTFTLYAMYQDFTTRYMFNIKSYGVTAPADNGTNRTQGITIILQDQNTLADGGPVPAIASRILPSGTYVNYQWQNRFGNFCSEDSSNRFYPNFRYQAPDGTLDASDGFLACGQSYDGGQINNGVDISTMLSQRASDFHAYNQNPMATINQLLSVAGYVADPEADPGAPTFYEIPAPTAPSWWPNPSQNVPRGTPFMGTPCFESGYGWMINSPWNLLCVAACTTGDGTTDFTCLNDNSGPLDMTKYMTQSVCTVSFSGSKVRYQQTQANIIPVQNWFADTSSYLPVSPVSPGDGTPNWGLTLGNLSLNTANAMFTCLANDPTNTSTAAVAGIIGSNAGPAALTRSIVSGYLNPPGSVDQYAVLHTINPYPQQHIGLPNFNLASTDCVVSYDSYSATVTSKSSSGGVTTYTFSSPTIDFWRYGTNSIKIESDNFDQGESSTTLTFSNKEWKNGVFTAKHSDNTKYDIGDVVDVFVPSMY